MNSLREGIRLDQRRTKIELDELYPMDQSFSTNGLFILEKNTKYGKKMPKKHVQTSEKPVMIRSKSGPN